MDITENHLRLAETTKAVAYGSRAGFLQDGRESVALHFPKDPAASLISALLFAVSPSASGCRPPPLAAPSPHWQVRRQALTLKRKHPFQPVLSAPLPEFLRRRPPTSHWSPAHLSAAPEPGGSQALEGFGQGPASPCGVVCHSPPWTLSVGPASPEGIRGLN